VQRASKPAGSRTDDQDVSFEFFALDGHAGILADGNCLFTEGPLRKPKKRSP
jgi:hypothetical protein